MESVQAQSMPITETNQLCSTLPNGKDEDISKQLEDELLYGTADDGEALSDDALSEDSYRLRVSDDEMDASECVNKQDEEEATKKTESIESPSDIQATDCESFQQNDKLTDELNRVDSKAEQDFTDDDVLGQDDFCNNSDSFDLKKCPQLEPNHESKTLNNENSENPDISVKSDESSVVDNDNVQTETAKTDENSQKPSKSEESIEQEDSKSDKEDGISKTDSSDVKVVDNSDDVRKKSEELEEENKSNDNPEQQNATSDAEEKQDQSIMNDLNDKESHTDESSDSGITSAGQSVGASDDLSKEPSLNDENSNSEVKEKVLDGECESLDLDCSEIAMDVESGVAKKKDSEISVEEVETASDIKISTSEDGPNKRRLSLVENETSASKIACIEETPKQVDQTEANADTTIKIAETKTISSEKPAGLNFSIKAIPTESLRKAISSNEIIDIEDDNTVDSSSIVVSNNTDGNALSSDSTSKLESKSNGTKNDSTNKEIVSEQGNIEETKKIRRRRSRSGITLVAEKDLVARTRREAAQKAEVTVRKNIVTLNNDSDDSESNDSSKMIPYNPKSRITSPTSLKRNHIDADDRVDSVTPKKFKAEIEKENSPYKTESTKLETRKTLEHVRQFFLRDGKQKLKKLTQEELEELFIQKIIETITMRDEIGKLREQAKISERNQEATRLKCQQLTKQIKDFEMVLSRYAADRRNNSETVTPIKINRSVGLQVNFLNDHGVQNLRQIQAGRGSNQQRVLPKPPVNGLPPSSVDDNQNNRRGLKVRSPRRSEAPAVAPIVTPVQTTITAQPLVSTVTQSAIPVAKTIDTRNTAVPTAQPVQQIHTNQIVLNGTITTQQRTTKVLTPNNKNNAECIDLTEDGKKKTPVSSIPPLAAIMTSATNSTTVPKVQTRFPRVVPTSASVTIPQSAIRVVQPAGQPTPTALVNNMSSIGGAPRFLMVQPHGATRQLLIAPNTQIRTSTVNTRPAFSNIAYASVPSMANGAVRVVPTSGTATVQLYKVTHPAPLPESVSHPPNPAWKLPPPAPSLKISKVAHGIVLSWNMALSDKFAEIASYQLYAYQEIAGMAPSSMNWKKVGDVRALPLPMACTLTQFSEGNNYHFAVRAVDTHSRYGQYSQPGNISL